LFGSVITDQSAAAMADAVEQWRAPPVAASRQVVLDRRSRDRPAEEILNGSMNLDHLEFQSRALNDLRPSLTDCCESASIRPTDEGPHAGLRSFGRGAIRRATSRNPARSYTDFAPPPPAARPFAFLRSMSGSPEGGCACGAVRYRLTSEPLFVHCCHCLNCQRQTGSAFVINLLIEADRVELLAGAPHAVDAPRDDGSSQRIFRCPSQVAVFSEYGRPEVHDSKALWPAVSLERLEAVLAQALPNV
jgi:hypothetical protein